ncbi:circadian clock protein KaiC [Methylobacter sp. S3L5C]|uniref:circadian clock protein KaiC n=1 Tax=Methylobacter sp. S3L5C TaxID=2839024 RepID=UPI001FAD2D70|nr:circadian clock protein KaiC [Methylobacter sp. S3L5C]UOA07611.1 circadian clock protein KaiC [Methylobacter sp. S3L5C]
MSNTQQTELNKIQTGIRGLDDITNGGLPRGRGTLLAGGPGCGKTVIALQILVYGAKHGEPGIFVTFEEDSSHIINNASAFGWSLPELEGHKLFFLDAKPRPDIVCAGQFDLSSLLASLKVKADQMTAKRIVFDSIDVLLSLLDDPLAERRELFRLNDWLISSGLTGIITCKNNDSCQSRLDYQDFMQYMVDCMIFLRHDVDNRLAHRTMRIIKYRGSSFNSREAALLLGDTGAEVIAFTLSLPQLSASTERISSGIDRLDSMLGSGYYRGSAVVLSGAPGTAKTTLCGCFLLAACERGERSLFIGFDEPAQEIVRNLRSVGIDLGPYVDSGLLHIQSLRSSVSGTEEHMGMVRRLIETYQPRCLVIDPLSAIVNSHSNDEALRRMPEQLLALTKSTGITMVCTSLLASNNDALNEDTNIHISTVADTWIHISYAMLAGERNRALTIVKSRGTEHSNQVRELILNSSGVSLADVYQAGGEVLMGTARWQKETAEKATEDLLLASVVHKRRAIELAQAEVNARVEVLQVELAVKEAELKLLLATEDTRVKLSNLSRDELWSKRSGDDLKPSSENWHIDQEF